MIEIWKKIKDFSDYEVSNMGNVKSFKFGEEKILRPGEDENGYLKVVLYKNKKPHTKRVHRLVLETFDPRKDMGKYECNHEDGNKKNNKYPENLEWCTRSENMKHAFKIGLIKKGEESPLFGKHPSEETKRKQSENNKGENNSMFGIHHTEETKRKQSETRKELFRIEKLNNKGENNPHSTLTEKKVIEIWKDLNEGILSQKEIAEKFGVDPTTISNIKTGRTWNYLK